MSGNLLAHAGHATGGIHQDENILGASRRLDVPAPGSAVEEIHRFHAPVYSGVLAHEAGRAAEILPAQGRVLLVVVDEGAIERLGPLDRSGDVRGAFVHVCGHVHRGHIDVHLAAKVRTVLEFDRVVLRVDELVARRRVRVGR